MKSIFEDLKPLYAAPEYKPTKKFRREENANGRVYLSKTDDGFINIYKSVTTAIGDGLPTDPNLISWIADQGSHAIYRYNLQAAADYGTFMHAVIDKYIKIKVDDNILTFDPNDLVYDMLQYFKYPTGRYIIDNETRWISDGLSDLLSFAKFFDEHEVYVLAVEPCEATDNILKGISQTIAPLAGAIDLVCEMKFGGKRIWAIVDYKSSRKGTRDSYVYQLYAYRHIWNENYPQHRVEHVFNWQPKAWRGEKPTYDLTNQTDKKTPEIFYKAVELGFLTKPLIAPTRRVYLPIEKGQPIEDSITTKTLAELWA